MERPLKEHIAQLERKIVTLKKEMRDDDLPARPELAPARLTPAPVVS